MSSIHYFQRYTQKENVATNNTLLPFSRLYQHSPSKFKVFLAELLEDKDIEVGVQFSQQLKSKGSIPDGAIFQSSFKIVIETKMHSNFSLPQLQGHLEDFSDEKYKVLLSLSPSAPKPKLRSSIESAIEAYNADRKVKVKYIATTFNAIVKSFKKSIETHDFELNDIISDFEEYCFHDRLINDDSIMKAVTCGWTIDENFKYNLYYASRSRGYSDHAYLGIYAKGSIRGIGKIINIIEADLTENGELKIISHTTDITQQQKTDIINVIAEAKENNGWDITKEHRFFCVGKFYETEYNKNSPHPLQGSKLFNLKEELQMDKLPDVSEIAKKLKTITW